MERDLDVLRQNVNADHRKAAATTKKTTSSLRSTKITEKEQKRVIEIDDETPKKKKRLSKQGKKAWRKNLDESKALETITTGKWKREAADRKKRKNGKEMTREERKKYNKEKVLARDGANREKSLAEPPGQAKRRKLTEDNLSSVTRQKVHEIAHKMMTDKVETTLEPPQRKFASIVLARKTTNYDIWETEPVVPKKHQYPEGALLPKSKLGKNKIPAKPEASLVPAVEIDLPGNSYNPTYEDHQDVLGVAVAMVMKEADEHEKLERVLSKPKSKRMEREEVDQIISSVPDVAGEESETEEELKKKKPTNHPIFSLKLSEKERRKQKAKKERRRQAAYDAHERKRASDIDNVDKLLHQIEKADQKSEIKKQQREQKKAEQLLQPRRLGKHKVELPAPEVFSTDELPSSLREVVGKKNVNLFKERYTSMLKRNLIEPRVKQTKTRKYQLKWHTKPSKKDF